MLLKIDMRELRLRALEAGPGRLVVTLGADAALDPARSSRRLVQKSKGVYRLTPDMKLVARVPPGETGHALLGEANEVLRDLSRCALEG